MFCQLPVNTVEQELCDATGEIAQLVQWLIAVRKSRNFSSFPEQLKEFIFSAMCTTALGPTHCLIKLIFGASLIRPRLEDANSHPLSQEWVELNLHAIYLEGLHRYNTTQHFTLKPFASFLNSSLYVTPNKPELRRNLCFLLIIERFLPIESICMYN
jgi:hypothetical protein